MVSVADYRKLARQMATRYGLDPSIFERQIQKESGFNPNARSPAGATGIAQIMPATAKGWGVNPNDPKASLAAAAKNMARYLDAYHGSYAKALAAYNAGPGNVQKYGGVPPFAETQNYVRTILGGRRDVLGGGRRSSGTSSTTPAAETRTTTSVDQAGYEAARRKAILVQFIARRNPTSILLRYGVLGTTAPSLSDFTSSQTETVTPRSSVGGGGSSSSSPAPAGTLRELFYNGAGGVNVDEGKRVPKGFVSGHTDHVHAAVDSDADRAWIINQARGLGLTITSTSGGKHAAGSFHYQRTKKGRSKGLDIGGDPQAMARLSRRIAQRFGVR